MNVCREKAPGARFFALTDPETGLMTVIKLGEDGKITSAYIEVTGANGAL